MHRKPLLYISLILFALAAALAVWWVTPLAPPLEIDTRALAEDYTQYWTVIGAGFGVLGAALLGVLIDIDVQLRKLRSEHCPNCRNSNRNADEK